MELNEYAENKTEDLIEEKVHKIKQKRTKKDKDIVDIKQEVIEEEISDDEATDLYKNIFNIILYNKKLREIEDDEIVGIKKPIGNITRILFKYLGGYKVYIDLTLIGFTSVGIYKQRVSENIENKIIDNKTKINNVKNIKDINND